MQTNYKKLALTVTINFVVMFLLTYALIADWDHFYPNINRAYMAIIMAAPMMVVMLVVMRDMYPNKKLNNLLISIFTLIFAVGFLLARSQTPVGNDQFLRSMIPHHSSAILMCEESQITDPEIIELCDGIVTAQKEEIAEMKALLGEK